MRYFLFVSIVCACNVTTSFSLTIDQFRALFGASRCPKCRSRDTVVTYPKSNHVAVMCRNQLFYFQAIWPDNGDVAVNEGDLVNILEAIQVHASKVESHSEGTGNQQRYINSVSALGVLTSLDRNQWARARDEMIQDSMKNAERFRVVDSALFVLVLDDYIPKSKHDAAANMLHGSYELAEWKTKGETSVNEYQSGSCTNRWYDKLQVGLIYLFYACRIQEKGAYRNMPLITSYILKFRLWMFTKDHCDCRWWCRNQF